MAKVKGFNPPVTEESYEDAGGVLHYFGELFRMVFGEPSVSPTDPDTDIISKSRRGKRPTEQEEGTEAQKAIREAFKECMLLWNALPEECPDPLPYPAPTTKQSVWEAKGEHGVPCSYLDLFMRCCMKHTLAHNGVAPTNECFPCILICVCDGIAIGYTSLYVDINVEQTLTVIGALEGCVYAWSLTGDGSLSANEGASVVYTSGANIDDDGVITLSIDDDDCDLTIINTGLPWEPWGGPEVCATEADRWQVYGYSPNHNNLCPVLPLDEVWTNPFTGNDNHHSLQINNGILNYKVDAEPYNPDGSESTYLFLDDYSPQDVPSHYMIIKIKAECIDTDPYFFGTAGFIVLREKVTLKRRFFVFCKANWTPSGEKFYIGDNEGKEQIIDLTKYGFDGTKGIKFIEIGSWCCENNHVYMDIDYIDFV